MSIHTRRLYACKLPNGRNIVGLLSIDDEARKEYETMVYQRDDVDWANAIIDALPSNLLTYDLEFALLDYIEGHMKQSELLGSQRLYAVHMASGKNNVCTLPIDEKERALYGVDIYSDDAVDWANAIIDALPSNLVTYDLVYALIDYIEGRL